MKKWFVGAVLSALLSLSPAFGGTMMLLGAGTGAPVAGSPPAFSGPGDVVSSAKAWWGLRAYSVADKGNPLINVCDAADAHCVDFSSDATTGKLVAQTVGVTDCTAVSTCTIKTWYDRSGANNCTGAVPCDVTQATIAKRATLTWSCINGLPCAVFLGSASQVYTNTATFPVLSQQFTISIVADRTGAFTSSGGILGSDGSGTSVTFRSATNTVQMYAGTSAQIIANISDSNFHTFQAVFNGASSLLMCGGSAGTSCSTSGVDNSISPGAGSFAGATILSLGAATPTTNFLTGNLTEVGIWSGGFSAVHRTNMTANQYNFWGPF